MFVECNQAVCCWFGAACHEKKESLSISAFKYPRVAMFIWKANIYCTHLYELRNRVCTQACILILTRKRCSRRNFNLWESRQADRGVRKRVFNPCQKFALLLKMTLWSSTILEESFHRFSVLLCSDLCFQFYLQILKPSCVWSRDSACYRHISLGCK